MTGEGLPLLVDLVDRGIIRILDFAFVMKELDGSVHAIEIADFDGDGQLDLAVFEGASSGLLDEGDLDEAGGVLEPGCSAGVLVYENVWAAPLAVALRRGGAQMVASGRIPVQALLAAAEALDAADAADSADSAGLRAETSERERAMPGLMRGVARTAVIAGTATSVSNRVSRRQAGRWAEQDQQQQAQQQQQYQEQAQQAPPAPAAPAAPAAPDMDAKLAQLKDLGELKAQGILDDAEFEAQKARILNS